MGTPKFSDRKVGKKEETPLKQKPKRPHQDWTNVCECGGKPVVPETGLCGPCTFGEADTANGNW